MGRRTGTGEELDSWRLLLTAAEERCESSVFDGRWRGGSVEEKSGSPSPGAPDVNGDLSRHGEARRLRRSPWSRSIDGVNNRRHFSLWTRREECQSSRDKHNTHASSRSPPLRTHLQKSNQAPTLPIPEPTHSGADGLLQWRRMGKKRGEEKRKKRK